MTLIRNLALALFLVLLSSSYSNAQVDQTTGNLINNTGSPTATTSTWINGVYVNELTCWSPGEAGNCGPNPSITPAGGINFSYGTTDLNQVININNALATAGTGIQVSGFKFTFSAKNGSGWDDGRQDYLSAYVKLFNSAGSLTENYDYTEYTNKSYNWTNFAFSETFANPYTPSSLSTAQVGFVGRDNNFWAGTYGPEINNVGFNLKYKVDPCAMNPAFSPQCPGFDSLLISINVVPHPTAIATSSHIVDNSFPIATVLASSGSGLTLHGFKYGFTYELGQGSYGCTATNQDGSCSWWMTQPAQAIVKADIRNNLNQSLFSQSHVFSGESTGPQEMNYQYLFPQSTNTSLMSNFGFTAQVSGTGSTVTNMYSKLIVTPDPCTSNPYYSNTCTKFQEAVDKLLGTNSTDYATTGYTEPASVTAGTASPTAQTFTTSPAGTTIAIMPPPPPPNVPPPAPNTQPKVGEITVAGTQSKSVVAPNISMIMSMINAESTATNILEKTVAQAAMAEAQAAGTQATQQAESIAAATVATSIANSTSQSTLNNYNARTIQQTSVTSFTIQSGNQSSATSIEVLKPYTAPVQEIVNTNMSSNFDVVKIGPMIITANDNIPQVATQVDMAPQQPIQVQSQTYQPTSQLAIQSGTNSSTTDQVSYNVDMVKKVETFNVTEVEIVKTETLKMGTRSTLNDYLNTQSTMQLNGSEQLQDGNVKRNAQPNEVAGGVDINTIATQPKGYELYAQMALSDASFYKVDSIYKDQRTIDNAKVLRGLQSGSDRLHQNMVDQQYKGN